MDDSLRKAPVGVIETTVDGEITEVNRAAATTIERNRSEIVGRDIRDVFPKSATGTLREVFVGESPTEQTFEEYYPRIEQWLAIDVHVGGNVYLYLRDQTARRETERTLEQLEQRLERVQRIDSLIVTVLQRLVDASDRTEVGETVCDRLGGTDPYSFVWVGDRDFHEDTLQIVATGGSAPDLRAEIDDALGTVNSLPEQEAVRTGETQLSPSIPDDDSIPKAIRTAAFGHGFQSCLAVPLEYQGTVHGVAAVYSRQEAGFSEQERAGLETLGRVAGFAINAIRQADLLVADTITEVTLQVRDNQLPFVLAARETEGEVALDGAVPRGDGAVVCYASVAGSSDGVVQSLTTHDSVVDVRRVRDEGDEQLLQVTILGDTPLTTLSAWGATVSTAEYTPEVARIVARAPSDQEVRRMVEAVDATVAETTLLSKEETTRNSEQIETFRDSLAEELTERQRTVLRAAYMSDYFASPRGSTSEEVADALDITGPTMLYHLRRAERKLVGAFLESDPQSDPTEFR